MSDIFIITIDGKKYAVPKEVVELNMIVLPNGSVWSAKSWLTFDQGDPEPILLQERIDLLALGTPDNIAEKIHGVVATPISN